MLNYQFSDVINKDIMSTSNLGNKQSQAELPDIQVQGSEQYDPD